MTSPITSSINANYKINHPKNPLELDYTRYVKTKKKTCRYISCAKTKKRVLVCLLFTARTVKERVDCTCTVSNVNLCSIIPKVAYELHLQVANRTRSIHWK